MKKTARTWVGVSVTALILGLLIYRLTRSHEWRHFDRNRLSYLLLHAKLAYLLPAVIAIYFTYVLRAVRWKFFLEPLKSGSLWALFVGQIFGFAAIFLIGRPGEVVRPAYIAAREYVSFASQSASLIMERR